MVDVSWNTMALEGEDIMLPPNFGIQLPIDAVVTSHLSEMEHPLRHCENLQTPLDLECCQFLRIYYYHLCSVAPHKNFLNVHQHRRENLKSRNFIIVM
jgi:hypothetical protein